MKLRSEHYLVIVIATAAILFGAWGPAQNPPKPRSDPTVESNNQVDSLKLQLAYEKQKNAILQSQLLNAQYRAQSDQLNLQFNDLEKQIEGLIEKVRKESNMGDDMTYDREHNSWVKTDTAPPAPRAPAKK